MLWLKRFFKWYTLTALVVFNTLLLGLVVLLLFMPGGNRNREKLAPVFAEGARSENGRTTFVSHAFKPDQYTELSEEAVKGTIAEFEAWVARNAWQIDPMTGMLVARKTGGKYLNVDCDGRRHTLAPAEETSGFPEFVVAAFGGSTMFSWGLPDWLTFPSLLQQELQARLPDRRVRCINFGCPFYNSGIELQQFLALAQQQGPAPDVCLFLDGLNDIAHFASWRNPNPTLRNLDTAYERFVNEVRSGGPLTRIWAGLKEEGKAAGFNLDMSSCEHQVPRLALRLRTIGDKQEIARRACVFTQFNWSRISEAAAAIGSQVMMILQPIPPIGLPVMEMEEPMSSYMRVMGAEADNATVLDFSEFFVSDENRMVVPRSHPDMKPFYPTIDNAHYSEAAMRFMAAATADAIMRLPKKAVAYRGGGLEKMEPLEKAQAREAMDIVEQRTFGDVLGPPGDGHWSLNGPPVDPQSSKAMGRCTNQIFTVLPVPAGAQHLSGQFDLVSDTEAASLIVDVIFRGASGELGRDAVSAVGSKGDVSTAFVDLPVPRGAGELVIIVRPWRSVDGIVAVKRGSLAFSRKRASPPAGKID